MGQSATQHKAGTETHLPHSVGARTQPLYTAMHDVRWHAAGALVGRPPREVSQGMCVRTGGAVALGDGDEQRVAQAAHEQQH